MVGIRVFPSGIGYFQGRTVSFRKYEVIIYQNFIFCKNSFTSSRKFVGLIHGLFILYPPEDFCWETPKNLRKNSLMLIGNVVTTTGSNREAQILAVPSLVLPLQSLAPRPKPAKVEKIDLGVRRPRWTMKKMGLWLLMVYIGMKSYRSSYMGIIS